MSDWALSSHALLWLEEFIEFYHLKSIVELGSGKSTLLLAKLIKLNLIERALTIEHDAHWSEDTIRQLEQAKLLDCVQVYHCPLKPHYICSEKYRWYDLSEISPIVADLVLVDGPPHTIGPLARYPAPHLLGSFIRPGTWMILDDFCRTAEQAAVKRWREEFSLELVKLVSIDTGLAVLRFQ